MGSSINEVIKPLCWHVIRRWVIKIFAIFLVSLLIVACVEGSKERVTGKRIISLAPHITEIIYAIGAEDNLVAVTDFCKYPPAAQKIEKIGGLLNPNIEKILRLKPTHLFGVPAHEQLNQELHKFGLSILMIPNETVSDVLNSIEQIGKALQQEIEARRLIASMKADMKKVRNDEKLLKTLLIIGREKGTLRNITAAGSGTFIDEIWQLVGGQNIFSDLPTRYSSVNLEEILRRDPDIIIEFEMDGVPGVYRQEIAPEWEVLEGIKALKNKNLFLVRGSHTLIPGPRMVMLAMDFHDIIMQAGRPASQKNRYIR